ncbi:hypothetical protein [Nitrococcus mobilis]|uniref:Uncharacterized protein n=1 Tax=Nitrococcus mobilis Nb-231 TaxID=314278 RepID=A4BNM0_9GAMM|nr:hypothetical protein [Nitrococcus mobilis]EAR22819.1 hypothetical protein NB231_10213 [Nitrococcus mobilis Nb-231]
MANIMIRDLSVAKALDRQASRRVKGGVNGGWGGGYLKPFPSPIVLNQTITPQIQVAVINNTVVGFGDLKPFGVSGIIGQGQRA